MQTPPMTQARMAAVPAEYAPFHEPNSQPEPMIEVADAHVAPMNPISRWRPTSVGTRACRNSHVRTFFPVRFRGRYARA